MTEFPAEPPTDPTAETQVHIPEFKREGGPNLPVLGLLVIFVLFVAGAGLLTFAFVYGQQETETRAINGTVVAVLAFTHTPTHTRPPSNTPVPTVTTLPTDTPTETPLPSETPTGTVPPTDPATATSTRRPPTIVIPTGTPEPPTNTPAPAIGAHGITGNLQLCDPGKTTYAAKAETSIGLIERVCIIESIQNHNGQPVTYGILGVLAQNTSGGSSQFQTSWRGDLKINGGCSGPSGDGGCGGAHTDTGFFIDNPGNYTLTLRICYSSVDVCLGSSGDWETISGGIPIQVISWTPSP